MPDANERMRLFMAAIDEEAVDVGSPLKDEKENLLEQGLAASSGGIKRQVAYFRDLKCPGSLATRHSQR